jgi:hypothetical protein
MLNIPDNLYERFHIFRKAKSAVADFCYQPQKVRNHSLILTNRISNTIDIGAHFFSKIRNFINETDFCCQKGVSGNI